MPAGSTWSATLPSVVSRDCERSVRLLMMTLAQHRRAEAAFVLKVPVTGRLKVLPPGYEQRQVRCAAMLTRLVSIMESYVHGQLVQRLELLIPPPRSDLLETLYVQFEDKGTSSWVEMANYFKKHVSNTVQIKTYAQWDQVNAVIEARNAIVHGLGSFTSKQVRRSANANAAPHLRRLAFYVPSNAQHVSVTSEALDATATLLRNYMEWLDRLLAGVS